MKKLPVAKKEQGLTLKTPQSLIHIKHRISLLQYKLWILLLHELKAQFDRDEPTDSKGFRYIPMQEIIDRLGYTPKKSDIWQDLLGLKNETIAFNFLEKDGQSAKYGAGFISEWIVTSNRIGFKFPTILEEVMRGLDDAATIFHKLNWEIFNHFSGKYEAIIYKLCKDYLGIGRTPYITVLDFREYMGLKEQEYSYFDDLNRRCIKNPIKNINESVVADIMVSVEFHRNGRKVEGLYFTMQPKYQTVLPFIEFENHTAFSFAKVTISAFEQQNYLENFSAEEIQASIERANQYGEDLESKGKKVKYGAIYKKAIDENWGKQFLELKQLEQVKKSKIIEVKKSEKDEEQLLNKEKHELELAIQFFESLNEVVRDSVLDQVEGKLSKMEKVRFNIARKAKMAHKERTYAFHFKQVLAENGFEIKS